MDRHVITEQQYQMMIDHEASPERWCNACKTHVIYPLRHQLSMAGVDIVLD